ncbi:MAG: MBL fold metallo-hydrolase, partial [Bacteroidota bacterium]
MPIPTEVTPLGTSGAIPTADRHLSGLALRREGRVLLFDCGEGTQLRLLRAGLLGNRLEAVFITHLHGDHVYGLPGLLSTLGLLDRSAPLTLVGPEGLADLLAAMPGLSLGDGPYPLHITELPETLQHETVYRTSDFRVEARPLAHRVPCVGYRYAEASRPGRFDAQAAREAGVTPGPDFEVLARG